jgi:hypothetical protein
MFGVCVGLIAAGVAVAYVRLGPGPDEPPEVGDCVHVPIRDGLPEVHLVSCHDGQADYVVSTLLSGSNVEQADEVGGCAGDPDADIALPYESITDGAAVVTYMLCLKDR